jgi:hypothetical protein
VSFPERALPEDVPNLILTPTPVFVRPSVRWEFLYEPTPRPVVACSIGFQKPKE